MIRSYLEPCAILGPDTAVSVILGLGPGHMMIGCRKAVAEYPAPLRPSNMPRIPSKQHKRAKMRRPGFEPGFFAIPRITITLLGSKCGNHYTTPAFSVEKEPKMIENGLLLHIKPGRQSPFQLLWSKMTFPLALLTIASLN